MNNGALLRNQVTQESLEDQDLMIWGGGLRHTELRHPVAPDSETKDSDTKVINR